MPGDVRPFKSRADSFLDQLIASALTAAPTPEIRLVCARASLKVALAALREEPPDLAAVSMFVRDALEQINESGLWDAHDLDRGTKDRNVAAP